ncbi:CIC11C00000003647 [Sungouiella intermedia]|uniref:CIC11C00000003466 n=1 Tax=Sungouiella intermedia TaxID=45354 RepID=A0A1L0C4J2_9ASCO|nr:CIC11C00000003647 [[Candida] intermedia]SGZ58495.1 CIC11C00000003466 [[Candida] intermedia]
MPSRNSINKPKGKIHRAQHGAAISKKRAARSKAALPTRSSAGRYNTETAPRPTDSHALALYSGSGPSLGSGVTTKSLSKKRAKKIERNSRYVAKRNEQLSIDLAAKEEGMDVDMDGESKRVRNKKPQTQLEKVKEALWAAVDDVSGAFEVDVLGEGTTIGIQAF